MELLVSLTNRIINNHFVCDINIFFQLYTYAEDEHGHEDEDEDEHDHEDEDEHGHEDEDEHGHDDEDEEFSSNTANAMNANSSGGKPWKEVILATLLVNVAALTGVIFLIPTVFRRQICGRKESAATNARHSHGTSKLITLGIPAFAAGALLAASVFLIIPEANLLVRSGKVSMLSGEEGAHDDHDDHGDEDMHAEEEDDHGHGHRFLQDDGHDDHDGKSGLKTLRLYRCILVLHCFRQPHYLFSYNHV